ncbi:hypothetical protein PG993_004991 [Apiospora rasikravindrae]|uniref:Uncharacterized protein n=1 Tax=Apiospora rasikravindrae TaxID=990691 RepID=A0ABR1TEE3_9PEZI
MNSNNDQGQFANDSSWLFHNPDTAATNLDPSLLPQFFPPFAQEYDPLLDFTFNSSDQPSLQPQQDGSHSINHESTNVCIGRPFSTFADGRVPNTCFGSVPEVRTRIRTASIKPIDYGHTASFAVSPITSYYGLEHSGAIFALISKTNCAIFSQLFGGHHVQLQAFVHDSVLRHALTSHSAKHPATLKVDINVYGVREEAYGVGKVLSSGGLTLQQPTHGLEGITYYNPHFLHIQEFEGEHVEETPRYKLSLSQGTHPEEQSLRKSAEGIAGGDIEIETIFNGLTHTQQLQRQAADRVISCLDVLNSKTSSADHTKAIKKKQSILSYGGSPSSSDTSSIFGLNTKQILETLCTRRAEPLEVQGGILADEMGLGKTIVTLAVIASTLDEASTFMTESNHSIDAVSQKQRSKATLVIAPSSYTDSLYQSDIVLTTYATISSEIRRGKSTLGAIGWFRIVLDEAHDIRNRNTRQFEVAASLAAQYRWCLTGTPIQNSLEDLGALVAFLRLPLLENALTFQRFIVNQSKQGAKYRFKNLRTLLEYICLRRTKEIIGLTDPVQVTRELTFTAVERDQYNELLRKYEALVDMGVQSFLKLRLFCNNGLPTAGMSREGLDPDETLTYLQQIDEAVCVYCDSTVFTINDIPGTDGGHMLAGCSHLACRDCYAHQQSREANCPKCTQNMNQPVLETAPIEETQAMEIGEGPLRLSTPTQQYPTKLIAFVGDIEQQRTHKSIVFSSWTKTLKLVCQLLECRGLSYYLVHGGLPLSERHRRLDAFQSPNEANILLMTLGTGAVGLNLAVASRIYLLEPQWNPSVEQQAFGRALRLGQTEQVTIIRYIMRDTVEDVRCTLYMEKVSLLTVFYRAMYRNGNLTNCSSLWEDLENAKGSP